MCAAFLERNQPLASIEIQRHSCLQLSPLQLPFTPCAFLYGTSSTSRSIAVMYQNALLLRRLQFVRFELALILATLRTGTVFHLRAIESRLNSMLAKICQVVEQCQIVLEAIIGIGKRSKRKRGTSWHACMPSMPVWKLARRIAFGREGRRSFHDR